MKVKYTLPVRGVLRVNDFGQVQFDGWKFMLAVNEENGFVDRLIVEVADIPKERWPTFSEAKQDPKAKIPRFPFVENPNAFSFRDIEPYIMNLESYLSVFGLEAIDYMRLKEKWMFEGEQEYVGMRTGFSRSAPRPQPVANPMTKETLARCIVASRSPEAETAALAHFRIGQMHFLNGRFIEAIRHLYLCLEYQFANGKFRGSAVLKEFCKSTELKDAIARLMFKSSNGSFDKIKKKYQVLQNASDPEDWLQFLVKLRGDIQHASQHSLKKWHPSREYLFEHEAVCVMNVVEEVCSEITRKKIMSIESCG